MSTKNYILISLLKIIIVIVLMIILLIIGAMIGYGVVGGGNPFDVFKPSTWAHIVRFLKK